MFAMVRKVKPIPRRLLPHSVVVEPFAKNDPFGKTYGDPITINHVRMSPAIKIRRSHEGVDVDVKSVLFIDVKNSSPAIALPVESKVLWRGESLRVIGCDINYAFDGEIPHHYEVHLI